jgi:preprotein translocase subunit Sss1
MKGYGVNVHETKSQFIHGKTKPSLKEITSKLLGKLVNLLSIGLLGHLVILLSTK